MSTRPITLFGHPWSINTRKVLATVAEKGHQIALSLVMIPRGEHKQPDHLRRHPFGKVPAASLIQRVHRESVGSALTDDVRALVAEVLGYPDVPRTWARPDYAASVLPILPIRFERGGERFSYFSAVTTLGTPIDITAQELRIECFFPVDEARRHAARRLAEHPGAIRESGAAVRGAIG